MIEELLFRERETCRDFDWRLERSAVRLYRGIKKGQKRTVKLTHDSGALLHNDHVVTCRFRGEVMLGAAAGNKSASCRVARVPHESVMSVAVSAVQQHEARQIRGQHGRRVGGGSAAAPSPLSFR